jgi:F420-0:gamma-glutamyl ligase-like protein
VKELQANNGKHIEIQVGNTTYLRFPIKTHVITKKDDITDVIQKYASSYLQKGDTLCVSERVVAITQGRSFKIVDIHPTTFATWLSKRVHKSPYGIGLASPWTMELAIREVGYIRILFGAVVAMITRPFGIKGLFYHIAGRQAAAIDGPCDYTLPPYNKCATLAPKDPNKVARKVAKEIGCGIVIIDANDLGVDVLGMDDSEIKKEEIEKIFKDNPLGQASEQTPLCIVRKKK